MLDTPMRCALQQSSVAAATAHIWYQHMLEGWKASIAAREGPILAALAL